jgi:mono/diheme cytochrome c family protein
MKKMGQPATLEKARVSRSLVSTVALLAGLAPAIGHAQTNIDQGKSPAEIFATDCATCHKTARGLANGRGSLGLASFLVEHYTASKDQAAALAAYVMGAGGGDSPPATPSRATKPAPDRAATAVEGHPDAGKPPPGNPATAKPRPPGGDVPSIVQEPASGAPGHRLPPGTHAIPAIANRDHGKGPESKPPGEIPAAVVAEPAAPAGPPQEASPARVPGPSAAVPANTDQGESAPVPRDNIPD